MAKKRNYSEAIKNLGSLFFIGLGVLTIATLAALILFTQTRADYAFVLMLVCFVLYVAWLIGYGAVHNAIERKDAKAKNEFYTLLSEECNSIYLSCYCPLKSLDKPNKRKKQFYFELSAEKDGNKLKERYEQEWDGAGKSLLGSFRLSYTVLEHIGGYNIILEKVLFDALSSQPVYAEFIRSNDFFLLEWDE